MREGRKKRGKSPSKDGNGGVTPATEYEKKRDE